MPRYKYTQESGIDFKVVDPDKADGQEDTNQVRQVVDDLGNLLVHSKRNDLYPKDGTTGGKLAIPENQLNISNIIFCSDYDHPDDAITAISTDNKTLLVTEAETCDTNFTVPANVTVKFERGGKWTINTGITVTFNGQIDAGQWQIFEYVGTGVLNFGTAVSEVSGEMFGAVGDNSTDDTTAFTRAIASMAAGQTLKIYPKTYKITNIVFDAPADCGIDCQGTLSSHSTGGIALLIGDVSTDNYRYRIKGLKVVTNGGGVTWTAGRVGVKLVNLYASSVEILQVNGFETGLLVMGQNANGFVFNKIYLGWFYNNKYMIYLDADTSGWVNTNSFYGGIFEFINAAGDDWTVGCVGITVTHYATHLYNNRFYDQSLEVIAAGYGLVKAVEINGKHTSILFPYSEPTGFHTPVSVTSITRVDTTATVTVTGHGWATGDKIRIAGASPSGYNGDWIITYVSADTFTYTVPSTLSTPATGTITAAIAKFAWKFGSDSQRSTLMGGSFIYESDVADSGSQNQFRTIGEGGYAMTWSSMRVNEIAFPAIQVPSIDVNTLDDYQEDEWTPALKFGGNSVDMIYTTQAGLYTKIGRQVTLTAAIYLTAKGTSTGNATITGLPFTSKNSVGGRTAVSLRLDKITFANAFEGIILENATYINLYEITEAGNSTTLTDADFANNSSIIFSATYFTE